MDNLWTERRQVWRRQTESRPSCVPCHHHSWKCHRRSTPSQECFLSEGWEGTRTNAASRADRRRPTKASSPARTSSLGGASAGTTDTTPTRGSQSGSREACSRSTVLACGNAAGRPGPKTLERSARTPGYSFPEVRSGSAGLETPSARGRRMDGTLGRLRSTASSLRFPSRRGGEKTRRPRPGEAVGSALPCSSGSQLRHSSGGTEASWRSGDGGRGGLHVVRDVSICDQSPFRWRAKSYTGVLQAQTEWREVDWR